MVRMPFMFSWTRSDRSEKPACTAVESSKTRRASQYALSVMIGSGGSSSRVRDGDCTNMNTKPTAAEKKSTRMVRVPSPTSSRTRPMSLMARAIRSPVGCVAKKRGPWRCRCA
jgi:hypothetical protein